MPRHIAISLLLLASLTTNAQHRDYQVAVYYFPNYHPDSINAKWHGAGWTEWDVVKAAKPRFPGHEQPKVPTWGYFNEADPAWAAKEIDLAADNGIDCFIYDWYWYSNTGQYLQEGLEKGFLKAPNRNRLKFAIMWANHDWLNIQPATFDNHRVALTQGEVSMGLWDTISTYIVNHYFKQPNYWLIDGKPYFSIYEIVTFINGLGGTDSARKAIALLDAKTRAAGFPGVHLNIMSWMLNPGFLRQIAGPARPADVQALLNSLSAESVSTYCYIHHYNGVGRDGFPTVPVEKPFADMKKYWYDFVARYPDVLYTPNISMGWDASPRCMQSDRFAPHDYPWTPVFAGTTPQAFESQLREARAFLDKYNPKHKIVVINAWNEWTEGSFLLPEKKYGDGYLKAIKAVFP
ncbi:MAG TPA: glycoside hydrolase family 99-like domain-containing protein [Dinghuibacter sp.]|uniref:glycoside hydrolase family 99-like domain-containing protein n=1 Tax=Dinghuibacter sp. TaxID=2024697 RepID=UPI002C5DCB76|nr:glycoside hydrolase family 99-like domain-containing protein [Dinghuibacter sp.]HTJ14597.1 glycoside hydrolase family 99-like domain-containing protein [Dinghuibacter sp.]